MTSSSQQNQEKSEADKPGKNSSGKGQAAAQNLLPALTSMLNESEDLKGDHRQHTWHQIENQTADKSQEKKGNETAFRRRSSQRNGENSRSFRKLPCDPIISIRMLTKHKQPLNRRLILQSRLKRNAKCDFIARPRFNFGMTNHNALWRERIKIRERMIRQLRTSHGEK